MRVRPQVGFPLSDAPCAVCKLPTVYSVSVLGRDSVQRVPCCDGCCSDLNEDRRMELLRAANERAAEGQGKRA